MAFSSPSSTLPRTRPGRGAGLYTAGPLQILLRLPHWLPSFQAPSWYAPLVAMPRGVRLYFDYISPYAYLLAARLEGFRARTGAEIDWVPIRLLGLSNFAAGAPYSANRIKYTYADVPRCAEAYGLPIRTPSKFPIHSDRALQLAAVARHLPGFPGLNHALFAAGWAHDQDLDDRDVLAACLAEAKLDAAGLLAEADSPEAARAVRDLTQEADRRGVFGVPTLAVDHELFWGNDRLPFVEWRLTGRMGPAS